MNIHVYKLLSRFKIARTGYKNNLTPVPFLLKVIHCFENKRVLIPCSRYFSKQNKINRVNI